jgi:hypothetical protein
MRALLVGIGLSVLAMVGGCASTPAPREASHGLAVHPCAKHPLMRSVGLFGGEQPEIFLSGPDLRIEPPLDADGSTGVLKVTEVDSLRDPNAQPVIDRCGSWLELTSKGDIEVTILWNDRNCPASFDEDDPQDCRSRAWFAFSPEDLGVQEILANGEDQTAAFRRLLVVDAYFTREIQPEGRHPATGIRVAPRSDVYLVVRLIRAARTAEPQSATSGGAFRDLPG